MIKFDLIAGGPLFFKGSQIVRQALPLALTLSLIALPTAALASDTCKKALESKSPLQFDAATGKASINIFKDPKNLKEKALNAAATQVTKHFFGLNKLQEAAVKMRAVDQDFSIPYFIRLTKALSFNLSVSEELLKRIPEKGPAIIVSNHPINGADLLSLAAVASHKRQDIKIVMNDALDGVPEMKSHALFINMKERGGGLKLIQEMIAFLQQGGLLVIAPSGEVSTPHEEWGVLDPAWKHGIVSTIEKAAIKDLQILPAFVEGEAGRGYQNARKLWARLERKKAEYKQLVDQGKLTEEQSKKKYAIDKEIAATATGAFNMKEIASHMGSQIDLSIGLPVSHSTVESIYKADPQNGKITAASYLRTRSLLLKKEVSEQKAPRHEETIILPQPAELIFNELQQNADVFIDTKPENENSGIRVYFAQGYKIDRTIQELGRLREIAFREVGEGSGKSCDVDRFDPYYHHLIAFDKSKKQIMGSYRAGLLKEILEQQGLSGVYSKQFFDVTPKLIAKLPTTVELGRSFLTKEYRGNRLAFPMLLAGIAQIFVKHPEYVDLMGVVSISDMYSKNSLVAMIEFLKKHHGHPEKLATAKTPPDLKTPITKEEWELLLKVHAPEKHNLKELSQLIGIIENDPTKKLPPLVGIYPENFNAKYIDFNYDADFKATDGLIMVHLPDLSAQVLGHFMGSPDKASSYLKQHGRIP